MLLKNQKEFFEFEMEKIKFAKEVFMDKKALSDCLFIEDEYHLLFLNDEKFVEDVYFEAQFYFVKKWQNKDLTLINFKEKIKGLEEKMKNSKNPFWEMGAISLCKDILSFITDCKKIEL